MRDVVRREHFAGYRKVRIHFSSLESNIRRPISKRAAAEHPDAYMRHMLKITALASSKKEKRALENASIGDHKARILSPGLTLSGF